MNVGTMKDFEKILREHGSRVDNVAEKAEAINCMFGCKTENITPRYGGFGIANGAVEILTVFQTEDITVTRGVWAKKGDAFPIHCHKESIEYLIVTKGKFCVKFNDGVGSRILGRGECASIPLGMQHSSIAMEDGSEMFAVCVPPERAYLK